MTNTTRAVESIICGVVADHGLDVGGIPTIEAVMQKIADGATLGDLGMDDLDVIEVVNRIEQMFGVSIPDDAITEGSRAGDIMVAVSQGKNP